MKSVVDIITKQAVKNAVPKPNRKARRKLVALTRRKKSSLQKQSRKTNR